MQPNTFKFSVTSATECINDDICDVNVNVNPSQVVSSILYKYEQSKSPSKRIIFSSESANCSKSNVKQQQRAKTAPMSGHSKLNLHGITLLKSGEQNEENEAMKEREIADLIWNDADGQNTTFTTPNISRLHTSIKQDEALLLDTIKVTALKSNDSDYPFYQTTYLKMAHMDDWDESYQRQLLCDYPQRNASIKQMFSKGLDERKIFKVLPKLFRIDSGLYDLIVSPNSKKQKKMKRKKCKKTVVEKKLNETEENTGSNGENDGLCTLKLQKLFHHNQQTYIRTEVEMMQNAKIGSNETSLIPYTPRALAMRRNCIGFRKKWS